MLLILRKLAGTTAIATSIALSLSISAHACGMLGCGVDRAVHVKIPNIPRITKQATKVVQQASKDVHNGFHELGKVKIQVAVSSSPSNNRSGEMMTDNDTTHENTGANTTAGIVLPLLMPLNIKPVEVPRDGYFENATPSCGDHCPVTLDDIANGKFDNPGSDLPDAKDIDSPNRWHPPVQQENSLPE